MSTLLDVEDVMGSLPRLGSWRVEKNRIVSELKFDDFGQAFAFMTRVALLAEKADHHPDLFNSYSTVKVELHSHDAGGITQRDLDMAEAISALLD